MSEQAQPIRVAVAGAGAFGSNHLRIYREFETSGPGSGIAVTLAAAIEPDATRAEAIKAQYNIPVFATASELLAANLDIQAASVAVPTIHHHAVASELLANGIDLLVEKPLAATLAEADALIALAEEHKRILQPGHLERFNPAVLSIEKQLTRPMFFESHRLSVFTPRALDVDVVLDLMIHDLDIVLTFAQSPVCEVRAVGLPILSPKVDIANVRIEFESGCVANFTASRVSTERVRKLRFFEPRRYVSLDYARRDALVISIDNQFDAAKLAQLPADALPNLAGLKFSRPSIVNGEPLMLEIAAFLHAVRTRQTPHVTAQQGRAALALALEIHQTMSAHADRAGLSSFFAI